MGRITLGRIARRWRAVPGRRRGIIDRRAAARAVGLVPERAGGVPVEIYVIASVRLRASASRRGAQQHQSPDRCQARG